MKNDHQTCHCNKTAFRVPIRLTKSDERLSFVEHVLDVLSESRTGRRRLYRIEELRWATRMPEFEFDLPDSFYNLTEHLRTHAQRFFSLARSSNRRLEQFFMTSVKTAKAIVSGYQLATSPRAPFEFRGFLPLPRGSP